LQDFCSEVTEAAGIEPAEDFPPSASVSGESTLAQAQALIADSGTGVRDLVGVILRERCAVVSALEKA
jgi:hypothetical protein